jgi:hypothetical protein
MPTLPEESTMTYIITAHTMRGRDVTIPSRSRSADAFALNQLRNRGAVWCAQ